MCHRRTYWEKTAGSEFETESEDESNERNEAAERGWWGVNTEGRRHGVVETGEESEATDDEREEDPLPTDD